MKRLILCLILLATQPVWAADTPQEFGWRVPIAINASAPYQRLTLPMAVYQNAAQLDLRDLRVFNSEGRTVPLAHMAQNGSHEKTSHNRALRWFPLTASQAISAASLNVRVKQGANGALVEVKSSPRPDAAGQIRRGYVLDASMIEKRNTTTALTLDWRDSHGFQLLDVDASDNLQDWHRVRSGVQLARLDYNGERIERRRIELNGLPGRYLRLVWSEPAQAPELTRAEIEETVSQWRAPPLVWTEPIPPLNSPLNLQPGEYHYRLPQTLPAARVRLALPQGNVLLPLEIFNPDRDRRHWRSLTRNVAYRITDQGREWVQDEIALSGYPLKEFILRIDRRSSQSTGGPTLQIGIEPGQVVFLAEGKAPYTLAVGNAQAVSMALPLNTLVPGIGSQNAPQIAEAQVLAGQVASGAASAPATAGQTDWKKIALWGVLIAGVLAMGAMAWNLVRQMKNSKPDA